MGQMDDDMSLIVSSLPVCDSGSHSVVPGRSLMPLDRVVTEAVPPRARGGKRIVQFSAMAVLFAAHPCSRSIASIWILGLHFRLRYIAISLIRLLRQSCLPLSIFFRAMDGGMLIVLKSELSSSIFNQNPELQVFKAWPLAFQ